MIKFLLVSYILVTAVTSCNQKQQSQNNQTSEHHSIEADNKAPYKDMKFDVKKDLVCGMPTSAGITDTAHYKGKVYGFCAKECNWIFHSKFTSISAQSLPPEGSC